MPLPDGTNAEQEDPSPPLGWHSKADLERVVLHEDPFSPPCVKIRLYLKYYGVPFLTKGGKAGKPIKPGGSYCKIPVLCVGDRQINDSYIILKHLVPALTGAPFHEDWEKKITFVLQPAIEIEAFGSTEDFTRVGKAAGYPGFVLWFVASRMSKKLAAGLQSKYPGLPASVEVGQEFAQALGPNKFVGGDKPGQLDISYFGTMLMFVHAGTQAARKHIVEAGLQDWWKRMSAEMPCVFSTPTTAQF